MMKPRKPMYRRLLIQFLLSAAIAVFFLWLTVTNMAGDAATQTEGDFWGALGRSIAGVPIETLLLYCLIFFVVHLIRISRWQYLIVPLGERDTKKILRICAVGFAAIVLLPLRLGEMVRPYLLSRESPNVSMSAALGTAVVERVIDGLLMTGLLFVGLATYSGTHATGFVSGAGLVAAAIFIGTSVVLVMAASRHDWTVRIIQATFGRISSRLGDLLVRLVDGFLDGVRVLRQERVLVQFLALTLLYWGLNGVGLAIIAKGFGFELSLWQAYVVISILVIGIMIPAGPGFFGNYQFFLVQGLLLFFAAEQVAIGGLGLGLTLNTVQFAIQVAVGIPFFLMSHVAVRKLLEAGRLRQSADNPT